MEVKIDLMTKEEMLQESYINKGNRYTTEEWQENGDYVTTDRNGYLNYANGEEVILLMLKKMVLMPLLMLLKLIGITLNLNLL